MMNNIVREYDLYFNIISKSFFNCCGDEDLYPFCCSNCGHIMVLCYECDTLYRYLEEDKSQKVRFKEYKNNPCPNPLSCPICEAKIDDLFSNPEVIVLYRDWIKSGYGRFLRMYNDNHPPVPSNIYIESEKYILELDWITTIPNGDGRWLKDIITLTNNTDTTVVDNSSEYLLDKYTLRKLIITGKELDKELLTYFGYSLEAKHKKLQDKKNKGYVWNPIILDYINV